MYVCMYVSLTWDWGGEEEEEEAVGVVWLGICGFDGVRWRCGRYVRGRSMYYYALSYILCMRSYSVFEMLYSSLGSKGKVQFEYMCVKIG